MTYSILSLDGGGAWALIEVRALMALFGDDATGHDVLRRFDMVAANSGGSLVLGSLVEGLPLTALLNLFEDEQERRSIFSPTRRFFGPITSRYAKVGVRYSAEAKLPAVQRRMPKRGSTPMNQVTSDLCGPAGKPVHLLVVAFDYDTNHAKMFRSACTTAPGAGRGDPSTATLPQAIHASTNAPVNYFDAPATFPGGGRYWDGGLTGNNNPVLAAVTEALALGHAPGDLRALSIGTGTVQLLPAREGAPPNPLQAPWQRPGELRDVTKVAGAILDDPPDFASYVAHMVTGAAQGVPAEAGSRIVRMNPLITPMTLAGNPWPPGAWTPKKFGTLASLDMDAVEPAAVKLISEYCSLWLDDVALNQAIRADGPSLALEVGHRTFSAAKAAWEALQQGAEAQPCRTRSAEGVAD